MTLVERAHETHPLALVDVGSSEIWSRHDDDGEDQANAKKANAKANANVSESLFADQRADSYLNGVFDGMMYGALSSLAEVARVLQNALLLKPVRRGARHDDAVLLVRQHDERHHCERPGVRDHQGAHVARRLRGEGVRARRHQVVADRDGRPGDIRSSAS